MVSDSESLTYIEHNVSGLLSCPRVIALLGSILVALSAGTNYVSYAPQLGARLHISHTQLNVVGLAANFGIYVSGPIWGRIVDSRGPRIPLTTAFVCFLVGYAGMKRMYDEGTDSGTSISPAHFALLVICGFLTGLGANAGLASAVNSTAKSFPEWARATTVSLVFSGLGLSAFLYSTVTNILFPGDTSAFLLLLALTTSVSALVALLVVRPVPLPPIRLDLRNDGHGGREHIPRGRTTPFTVVPDIDTVSVTEGDSRTPLLGVRPEYGSSSEGTRSRSKPDNSPDIHGSMLWSTPDFYLVCTIMSLLSGTGIMCTFAGVSLVYFFALMCENRHQQRRLNLLGSLRRIKPELRRNRSLQMASCAGVHIERRQFRWSIANRPHLRLDA
ncbi:major facilitator superfamily-domain-containing protein [Pisolithus thermaeus]|nr:major facilitator superfamily-domain-containing protein [Pisolithus thermaeus]